MGLMTRASEPNPRSRRREEALIFSSRESFGSRSWLFYVESTARTLFWNLYAASRLARRWKYCSSSPLAIGMSQLKLGDTREKKVRASSRRLLPGLIAGARFYTRTPPDPGQRLSEFLGGMNAANENRKEPPGNQDPIPSQPLTEAETTFLAFIPFVQTRGKYFSRNFHSVKHVEIFSTTFSIVRGRGKYFSRLCTSGGHVRNIFPGIFTLQNTWKIFLTTFSIRARSWEYFSRLFPSCRHVGNIFHHIFHRKNTRETFPTPSSSSPPS